MGILNDAVIERRDELIRALNGKEIYLASDGRYITGLSLADLERMNIEIMNEAARAFGDSHHVN